MARWFTVTGWQRKRDNNRVMQADCFKVLRCSASTSAAATRFEWSVVDKHQEFVRRLQG